MLVFFYKDFSLLSYYDNYHEGIQVRSLCDHVRPDRQCSLFSATFKKKIEKLARDVLTDPVKIVQGDVGVASENVTQVVKVQL